MASFDSILFIIAFFVNLYYSTAGDSKQFDALVYNLLMSGAHYLKHLELEINKFRKDENLRILWPDYEVYDLLAKGIALEELAFHTSSPPIIIRLDQPLENYNYPLKEKSLTHMAMHRVAEVGFNFQRIMQIYLIFTKRGVAVDQICFKYVNDRYLVYMQLAQIEANVFLWGAEVLTDQVVKLGPQNILKKKMLWYLDCESDRPIQSLAFFSTRRQPRYGKSGHEGTHFDMPEDSKLQFCMNYRTFKSYIDTQLSQQNLIEEVQLNTIFNKRNFTFNSSNNPFVTQKSSKDREKSDEKKVDDQRYSIRRSTFKQHDKSIEPHKSEKVKMTRLDSKQMIITKKREIDQDLNELLKQINHISTELFSQLLDNLQNNQRKHLYEEIVISPEELDLFKDVQWDEQCIIIQKAFDKELNDLAAYFFLTLLQQLCKNMKKKRRWIQIYQFSGRLQISRLRECSQQILNIFIVKNCHYILKDSEDELPQLLSLPNFNLKQTLMHCFEQKNEECQTISDMLFMLMSLEKRQNILHLYQSYKLVDNDFILSENISKWMENQSIPRSDEQDILYNLSLVPTFTPISHREKRREKKLISNDFQDKQFIKMELFLNSFAQNGFVSSKSYKCEDRQYRLYIFKQKNLIHCFTEEKYTFKQNIKQAYRSFDISIRLKIGETVHEHMFGWSFIQPSQAVGYSFQNHTDQPQIECCVTLYKRVVHQSLLNYFRIRYAQLLILPKEQRSNKSNQLNNKLLKRRSSFVLQRNLIDLAQSNFLEPSCYFHNNCQKCEPLLLKDTIYTLQLSDMYNLLKGASFQSEINVLLSLLKYISIHQCEQDQIDVLLQVIRFNYIQGKDLLQLYNQNQLQEKVKQLVSSIIELKFKNVAAFCVKDDDFKHFMLKHQGRSYKDNWFYVQKQCSAEYLTYMQNIRPK